jgi:hypothetical protein
MEAKYTKEDLLAAYLAGFAMSGEGWNGEYPYEESEVADLQDTLRDRFSEWLERYKFVGPE